MSFYAAFMWRDRDNVANNDGIDVRLLQLPLCIISDSYAAKPNGRKCKPPGFCHTAYIQGGNTAQIYTIFCRNESGFIFNTKT